LSSFIVRASLGHTFLLTAAVHDTGQPAATLLELEVGATVMGAISKFVAVYNRVTPTMKAFPDWVARRWPLAAGTKWFVRELDERGHEGSMAITGGTGVVGSMATPQPRIDAVRIRASSGTSRQP
jgi:hypothetical protein